MLVFTEHYRTHRILLEVQRHAERVARKFEHFAVAGIGETVNADDAVRNGNDSANVTSLGFRLEILDAFLNQLADFRSFECHLIFLFS